MGKGVLLENSQTDSSKQATPAGDTDLPTSKGGLFDLEPKKHEWRV